MLAAAGSGSDLDAKKSSTLKKLVDLPIIRTVAVIDDNEQDARHVSAVLHLLLGREVEIAHYRNVAVAVQKMKSSMPDLLVLDDLLPPLDRAESSIKTLQRFGYTGPIIIISGTISRARRSELKLLNPLTIVEKDDINTFSMAEALAQLLPRK